LRVVAELFQDRQDDLFLAVGVTAHAHADHDLGVDALFHAPDDVDDLLGAFHRHLDLDDGAHHLFIQDVGADVARGDVGHQGGDGVVLLERHAGLGQGAAHLLEVAETGADAGAAQLDGEAHLADADAVGDVVGLHFLGAAS
jgi:hypothetical protein